MFWSVLLSAFDSKQVWRLLLHQLGLLGSVVVSHRTLFYVNPFPARYCKRYCNFFGLDERSHSHKTPILSSLLQFSSRWYLCAQKSPYALHPVSQKFPHHCLSNSSSVHLTMAFSHPFKKDCLALPLSMPLLQAINGVMSLALCLQVVFEASQHLRSSQKQATCEGCFARQSICSVISI